MTFDIRAIMLIGLFNINITRNVTYDSIKLVTLAPYEAIKNRNISLWRESMQERGRRRTYEGLW